MVQYVHMMMFRLKIELVAVSCTLIRNQLDLCFFSECISFSSSVYRAQYVYCHFFNDTLKDQTSNYKSYVETF